MLWEGVQLLMGGKDVWKSTELDTLGYSMSSGMGLLGIVSKDGLEKCLKFGKSHLNICVKTENQQN